MLEDTPRVVRAAVPNPIFTDLWEILFFTIILYSAHEDNRVSLPEVRNLKIVLPWKNLPLDCRRKNIVEGYRKWFLRGLGDPFLAYAGTKRDIPEFVFGKEPIA